MAIKNSYEDLKLFGDNVTRKSLTKRVRKITGEHTMFTRNESVDYRRRKGLVAVKCFGCGATNTINKGKLNGKYYCDKCK